MVGVDMGVNDVSDLYILPRGLVDKPLLIAQHRVYGDGNIA
jgi:hypothetical protein